MLSLNFLVTCLIVVLIPGTGVIFTVSTGLTSGKRARRHSASVADAGTERCIHGDDLRGVCAVWLARRYISSCSDRVATGAEWVAAQFCCGLRGVGIELGICAALTRAAETSYLTPG